jgi:hypothetical protein
MSRTPRSRSRLSTWVRRVGIVMGLLLVVLVVAHWGWGKYEQSKLNDLIASYRSAGEMTTIDEFVGKPVPDATNAAIVLEEAASQIAAASPSIEAADAIGRQAAHPLTADEVHALREIVKTHANALNAPAVAAQRVNVRWSTPIATPMLINGNFKYLGAQRELASVIEADSLLAQHELDARRSLRRTRELLKLSEIVDHHHPMVISHLVSIGIGTMGANCAERTAHILALDEGASSDRRPMTVSRDEVVALIRELLDQSAMTGRRRRAWLGQRLLEIELLQAVADGRAALESLNYGDSQPSSIGTYLLRPLALHDARLMADAATAASKASALNDLPAFLAAFPQHDMSKGLAGWHVYARILMPSYERAMLHSYRLVSIRRMAAVVLASRLYALDHDGMLPPRLETLVPDYLPEVPVDAVTNGQPLTYDRERAMVYGVGINSIDDGGTPYPAEGNLRSQEKSDDVLYLKRPPRQQPARREGLEDDGPTSKPAPPTQSPGETS